MIQKCIREKFKCTIIAIAHRLDTIADYDKVMCVKEGYVDDLDTPQNLKDKHDSIYAGLLRETGKTDNKE